MLVTAARVAATGGHFASVHVTFSSAAHAVIAASGGLSQLLVQDLLDPAVPIFQVLALFFGVMAAIHAIAAHHGDESAALLLVKPVLLTVAVEGLLVVLKNAASLGTGGGITL